MAIIIQTHNLQQIKDLAPVVQSIGRTAKELQKIETVIFQQRRQRSQHLKTETQTPTGQ